MDCIFCKIANKSIDSMQLYEDDFIVAIMDINPHCDGHTLIIPKNHYEDYTKVPNDVMDHILRKAENLGNSIIKKLDVKGYTLAINYGDRQEVKHFHMHLMPSTSMKNIRKPETVFNLLTKKVNVSKK